MKRVEKSAVTSERPLRVAIIAPPWLHVPPHGYGGIEAVLDGLVEGLIDHGVEVEIFGVNGRRLHGAPVHSLYKEEQYGNIHRPMYEAMPIIIAHLEFALKKIIEDGTFDIIHDHNGFIGPQVLSWATRDLRVPPALHTHHGPPFTNQQMLDQGLPDNRPMWHELGSPKRSFIVGISHAMMKTAPKEMLASTVKPVHNAIDVSHFPFVENKKNYFITLARFNRDKGQHIAARLCIKHGFRLRMAGTVAGIETNRKLFLELANPLSRYRQTDDFKYYSDEILPLTVRSPKVTYTGNISGKQKMKFMSEARALLFPIDWEEPFGMAVIEALACGTPVIAMKRGAMPEIIEHGVNGFLAKNVKEFEEYMLRIDEIDPAACRESVVRKFSSNVMAKEYIKRYKEVIRKANKA
jgi:glycosyltransferase involved in cell wall biosynthesis